MSAEERQSVEYFFQWIQQGGLKDWIQHFIDQQNEEKLRQIKDIYDKIKTVFGF